MKRLFHVLYCKIMVVVRKMVNGLFHRCNAICFQGRKEEGIVMRPDVLRHKYVLSPMFKCDITMIRKLFSLFHDYILITIVRSET